MPRYRKSDPFGTKRVSARRRSSSSSTPRTPPVADGEDLAHRLRAAMDARAAGEPDAELEATAAGEVHAFAEGSGGLIGSVPVTVGEVLDHAQSEGSFALATGEEVPAPTEAPHVPQDELEPAPGADVPPAPLEATQGAESPHGGPISAVQAAEILNVDPAEVRRRCREGELAATKDDEGAWLIDPAELAT